MAEALTAKAADFLTLTYGREDNDPDHLRSAVLTYSDTQKYFKRLRAKGYKFRYFITGEYGAENNRAHWHVIMFWQNKQPKYEYYTNFMGHEEWPHGHVWPEPMSYEAVNYCCKYILKDPKNDGCEVKFQMSKKPPLGHDFFMELAGRYVEAGLAPQTLEYEIPNVLDKKGRLRKFMMQGKTAENFLHEFCKRWLETREGWVPTSELVEDYQAQLIAEEECPLVRLFMERGFNVKEAHEKAEEQRDGEFWQSLRKQYGDEIKWFFPRRYSNWAARLADGTLIPYPDKAEDGAEAPEYWRSKRI